MDQTIFIPSKDLHFDEKGRLKIFESRKEVKRLKFMTLLPLPFIGYTAYCLFTNVFITHSILKSIMWLIPCIGLISVRRNIV